MSNKSHYKILILILLFLLFNFNIKQSFCQANDNLKQSLTTSNNISKDELSDSALLTTNEAREEFIKTIEKDTKNYRKVIDWYMSHINYMSITLLMIIESSFIPFPSEVVIPPAAWKAAEDGSLNIFLIFLFSTLGALIGALINYYLSISLGRAIIYKFADTKFAHILLINKGKIEKAEKYFIVHGKSSTFIGRLVPGIRQLISIPAGLAKMNISTFICYTLLGAGIWNIILIALGYFLFSQQDLLQNIYHKIKIVLWILGGLFILYLIIQSIIKKKKKK